MRLRLCVRSDFEIIKVVEGKDASEAHSIIIIRSSNPQMKLKFNQKDFHAHSCTVLSFCFLFHQLFTIC